MDRIRWACGWLLLIGIFSSVAHADPRDYDFNFYFENDNKRVNLWGSDRAYTNGVRFSFLYGENEVPGWAEGFMGWLSGAGRRFNIGLTAGQEMYTPDDITRSDLIVQDRPYAGYLFTGLLLHLREGKVLQTFQFDFGVVGPPSGAEQMQTGVHGLFNLRTPRGWANQLSTEPILNVFYQLKQRLFQTEYFDFLPSVGTSFGNLYIFAGAGATARLGYQLSDDFGPTTISPIGMDPYVNSEGANRKSFEAYLFAGFQVRGVLRNLFLDGNTFTSSHRVDKRPFTLDYEFGAVVRIETIRIAWRQVVRSPEFQLEDQTHPFGSFSVSHSYRF